MATIRIRKVGSISEQQAARIAAVPVTTVKRRKRSMTDPAQAAVKDTAKAQAAANTQKTAAPKAITTRAKRRKDREASLSRYALALKRSKKRLTGNVTDDMVKQLSIRCEPKEDNGPYVDVMRIAWQGGAPGFGKKR